jgi:hypothetical protein
MPADPGPVQPGAVHRRWLHDAAARGQQPAFASFDTRPAELARLTAQVEQLAAVMAAAGLIEDPAGGEVLVTLAGLRDAWVTAGSCEALDQWLAALAVAGPADLDVLTAAGPVPAPPPPRWADGRPARWAGMICWVAFSVLAIVLAIVVTVLAGAVPS